MTDLSKSPARIAGMFDAIADRYDFLNHLLSAGIDRRWRKRAIRALSLTGTERVLDFARAPRDLAIAARTASPPAARVLGVDFAGAMLQVGRAKLLDRHLADRVTLVRGDAARIPVADAVGRRRDRRPSASEMSNRRQTACREMHRVLKPGGRLAILEFAVPTLPVVRGTYSLVLQARPAPDRATRLAPRCRVRLPAGLGQRLRVSG